MGPRNHHFEPFGGDFQGSGERREEFMCQTHDADARLRTKAWPLLVRMSGGSLHLAKTCILREDADGVGESWLNTSENLTLVGGSSLANLTSVQFQKWLIQKGYLPKQVFSINKLGWLGSLLELLFTTVLHKYIKAIFMISPNHPFCMSCSLHPPKFANPGPRDLQSCSVHGKPLRPSLFVSSQN